MKKKTSTYVLITLVVGIWGYIGYLIFQSLHAEKPAEEAVLASTSDTANTQNYALIGDYSDPFLRGMPVQKDIAYAVTVPEVTIPNPVPSEPIASPSLTYTPPVTPPVLEIPEPSPNVVYYGIVNTAQPPLREYFLIKYNGKQYNLTQGEEIDEVRLVKGDAQSITVEINEEKYEYTTTTR